MAKATNVATLPDETIGEALAYLSTNLRPADEDEVYAQLNADPYEAMKASLLASSDAWLVTDREGLPIALMGVAPSALPGVGNPWLVGTPGIEEEAISFARQTPRYVEEMHKDYELLTNFVDARNEASIDWLLFAGFSLFDADPRHGPEKRLFFQFTRSR